MTLGRPIVKDSLMNRVREFFLANPDEELTYADMAVKFSCTVDQARFAVRELKPTMGLKAFHVIRLTKAAAA